MEQQTLKGRGVPKGGKLQAGLRKAAYLVLLKNERYRDLKYKHEYLLNLTERMMVLFQV